MSFTSFDFDDNPDDYTEVFAMEDNIGSAAAAELDEYCKQSNQDILDKFAVMLECCMHGTHCEQDKIIYCTRGPRIDWIRNDKKDGISIKDMLEMVKDGELIALKQVPFLQASIGSLKRGNNPLEYLVVKSKLFELLKDKIQNNVCR